MAPDPAGTADLSALDVARPGVLHAFRYPGFRLVWGSTTLSQLGYWFSTIAFQWLVAGRTDNSSTALGILYFFGFLPFLLLTLPAGAAADSFDRRTIMGSFLLVGTATAAVAGLLATTGRTSVWALVALSFMVGAVGAITSPVAQALMANTVPARDLSSAVPLQAVGTNLSRVTGPALAGPVIWAWGAAWALAVYGVVMAVAATLLLWVRGTGRAAERVAPTESFTARIRGGFRYARSRPPAVLALVTVALTSVFAVSYQSQLPVLAARVSADPSRTFLVMVMLGGLGSLLGAGFVVLRRNHVTVRLAAVQLALLGLALVGMGELPGEIGVLLVVMLAGALTVTVMTMLNSVLQRLTDDSQRGRVMSLYFLCWGGLLPLGGLWQGGLAAVVGHAGALVLSGVVAVLAALAVLVLVRRGERHSLLAGQASAR